MCKLPHCRNRALRLSTGLSIMKGFRWYEQEELVRAQEFINAIIALIGRKEM